MTTLKDLTSKTEFPITSDTIAFVCNTEQEAIFIYRDSYEDEYGNHYGGLFGIVEHPNRYLINIGDRELSNGSPIPEHFFVVDFSSKVDLDERTAKWLEEEFGDTPTEVWIAWRTVAVWDKPSKEDVPGEGGTTPESNIQDC